MRKLIALDCDSFKIAYSIFVNNKLTKTGIIDSNRKLVADLRSVELYEGFCTFLDKEKPNMMVTEKSLYSNNFVSSRTITEVIAYCKLACTQRKIFFDMVYVPSWKKFVTGKGNAKKEEIKESIIKIYPKLTDATQDEIDSCSIALYYLDKIKEK
jgi:Holliday junction resolvasome RuvABC endonuclease subunit